MSAPIASLKTFAPRLRERLVGLRHSRRARRLALIATVLLVVYMLLGFFAVPAVLRHYLDTRASAMLDGRPVSVGALRFNPFTLKLSADRLHVGEADGKTAFVDIDQLVLNASWTSLFRFAPVLNEVIVQHPQIAIARTAARRFNFSDLIDRYSAPPATPPSADAKPARFSLSNIAVHAGEIRFDDRVGNANHRVEQLEIGIPFLANLPRDVDVYVQPLLAMKVDGSPLRIDGRTKPFADSLESTIDFHLDRLDLARYLGYVPAELPVAIPRGQLSGDLQLRFVHDKAAPRLNLGGALALDDFALTAPDASPIAEVGHASAELADVQPLLARYKLGAVRIERTVLRYTRKAEGRSNVDSLTGGAEPAQTNAPASEVAIASLALATCRFDYVDETLGDAPATITIDDIAGTVSGLDTRNGPPAAVDVSAAHNGGRLATKGQLDLPASRYSGTLDAKDVGLPPLQPFALPAGSRAVIQQGRFSTDGRFHADWKSTFNLHIEPATATISDFALGWRDAKDSVIAWSALDVGLTRFDLAAQEAQHGDVALRGLRIKAQRGRDGRIDLARLAQSAVPAKRPAAPKPAESAPWRWGVARFALDDGSVQLRDLSTPKPTELAIKSVKGEVNGLSEDLKRPLKLALGATIERGRFDLSGSVRPEPLDADLKIGTRELNLAALTAYTAMPFNVRVASALLSSDGNLRYAGGSPAKIAYRGRVALGRVRVQDKPTNEDFLSFRTLTIGTIDYAQHTGPMQLKLGDIALGDFYARVILNKDGKLNLSDISGAHANAPVSVTQPNEAAPSPPASGAGEAIPSAPTAPAAKIDIGQIALSHGRLNFTDHFIQPNYTANLSDLDGHVGAFGSSGGAPAAVAVRGKLDDSAEVDIDGAINPLAPTAFVDIKAKAHGVELTHLSAYAGKYAGYPILRGRLNADVAYLLDQGKLKADNHIVIDQLTFGDKIEGPGVSHLPVKLAVALLSDSNGVIDVNVPVSGSLDDPQFSLGGVIWRAFAGMIAKAATAPFRLLGAMFSGGDGGQDLSYVEFAPGSAVLDAAAKERLDKIVTAMDKRPAVNLDIGGRIDPALDEPGLRKVMLDDLIRNDYLEDHDKAVEAVEAKGEDAEAALAALPPLSPEDADKYLERVYKDADFKKEKTLVFVTKSQPPEEMRKLLEEHMPVDEDALHQLADRRASTVRAYLKGKIADKRIFVVAPKHDAKGIDDDGKTTRVEFGLH